MRTENIEDLSALGQRIWILNALQRDTGLRAVYTETTNRDQYGRLMYRLRPVSIDECEFWAWHATVSTLSANPVVLALEVRQLWAEWQRKVARGGR
jgi:hypothetical protein